MSAYYVIAIVTVVGAVVLSAIGLTREDFPPNPRVGRAVMAGTLLAVFAGVIALLATTEKEHPREEAAHAAAEQAAEKKSEEGAAAGGEAAGGQTVRVTEEEFSIALEGGEELEPGPHTFAVANEGQIDHDLAIEGEGLREEPRTPLIEPGASADLKADLEPGDYRFYCTVPGHAQSGMETDVTVR
ncbi:MAG: plastocyanin/azurin family copper-binding protein [Solirubrobacterales bacterium]